MKLTYPLLIDGGLSNVLEAQGQALNHVLWSAHLLESNPEAIIQAHYAYLQAGAQLITTASYQASIPGFMAVGHDRATAESLLLKTVDLAQEAIARFLRKANPTYKPLIAASIGPYGAFLADGSEYRGNYQLAKDQLKAFHSERIQLLDASPIDLFACETIPDFQEAQVLAEILNETQKTAWISFSCKDEKHLNDGSPLVESLGLFVDHPKVFAIGVNCTAPRYISGIIQTIKPYIGTKKIVVYPNSGESYHAKTKTWMGVSDPLLFVEMAKEWISLGVDIIGGCCRIGPHHIKLLSTEIA
jgi:homocysteine S-methyltransferase